MFRVRTSKFKRVTRNTERYIKNNLPDDTLDEFKKNTPKDTGNAKRNTKKKKTAKGFEIIGNYDYSGVLDEGLFPKSPKAGTGKTRNGYSTQAPKGMVKPTREWLIKTLKRKIKGFNKGKI
tara:strand:+ start:619 stop:981 length:363 start_codon:yes stop_codon:yes gene_type:complete